MTLVALLQLYRGRRNASRFVAAVLAFHWMWAGAVYHLALFSRINPAAGLFGIAFLLEAALLSWRGVWQRHLELSLSGSFWSRTGSVLVLFALLYPGLGLLFGLHYPRLPIFGVPCPTTLLTAGLLLVSTRREARILGVIPMLWAGVGGSAAFVLGIRADLSLLLAGVLLLAYFLVPRHGPERAAAPVVVSE